MSGGRAWIIDEDIDKQCKITYNNSSFTSCEINTKNELIVILMPTNNIYEFKTSLRDLDKILEGDCKKEKDNNCG